MSGADQGTGHVDVDMLGSSHVADESRHRPSGSTLTRQFMSPRDRCLQCVERWNDPDDDDQRIARCNQEVEPSVGGVHTAQTAWAGAVAEVADINADAGEVDELAGQTLHFRDYVRGIPPATWS